MTIDRHQTTTVRASIDALEVKVPSAPFRPSRCITAFSKVVTAALVLVTVILSQSGCVTTNEQTRTDAVRKDTLTSQANSGATASGQNRSAEAMPTATEPHSLAAPDKVLQLQVYKAPEPAPAKLLTLKRSPQSEQQESSSSSNSGSTVPAVPGDTSADVEELWQSRGETGTFGGTLTVATFGSGPKTFNYWATDDAESRGVCMLMFESLVDIDPWTGEFYPRLCQSIQVNPNKKQYTFRLRKGLRWSDGKPITADDVEFTFNTIVKHGYGNCSFRDTLMVENHYPLVKKIDALTVEFQTEKPFAPLLNSLRGLAIAPKHILEPVTKKGLSTYNNFWNVNCNPKSLVGSGPFMLLRYVPGQRVELTRNPNFAMIDRNLRRLPYLDKFVLAIVPDQNTEVLKFYGNELDFLDIRSVRGNDAALMKQRERTSDFKTYNLGPDDGTVFLMFNMNRRKNAKGKFYVDPIKQNWFNDLSFRQAITHAIDRRRVVSNVLRGVGLPIFGPESPCAIFYNNKLQTYPQDLALAQQLLAKGGFVLRDGKLFDRDGNRVEFTLNTNAGNSTREGTCLVIVEDLKRLGIKVNFQPIDFNTLVDKTGQSCDWEAVVMGLTGNKVEPYDGANVWKSDGRVHMFDQRLPDATGKVQVSDARDWEKQLDNCFDRAATTLDMDTRHKCWDLYQQIVYDQLPFIYVYSMLDITAIKSKIGNYAPTPLCVSDPPKGSLHNVEEIYIIGNNH